MAAKKITFSSAVGVHIDKTTKKLKSVRSRVAPADQKKIDLEIKALASCKKTLGAFCGKMTHAFNPKASSKK
jgi:hypothetical protein